MLALLLLPGLAGYAQQSRELEVRRVEADSLLNFLRREITPRIYYLSSEMDHSSFTISAPREQFLERAMAELADAQSVRKWSLSDRERELQKYIGSKR